jgi:hypothetical protein
MQFECAHELAVVITSEEAMVCVSDMDRLTKIMICRKLCDL